MRTILGNSRLRGPLSFCLLPLLCLWASVPASASVLYDLTFFGSTGAVVGNGFIELEASVRDAGIDLNDVMANGPYPPAASRFVSVGDLTAIELTLFGSTFAKGDLAPSLLGPDGVVFAASGEFLQFIDPNLGVTDLSATDVVFGTPGNRVVFDEAFPDRFEVQLVGATDCVRPSDARPGAYACRFSVEERSAVPEPASGVVALVGLFALVEGRRRIRKACGAGSAP